jgi:hypothetical protein
MTLDDLSRKAQRASLIAVLGHIDDCIRSIAYDTSAIAPEHALGYAAGFQAAKAKIRDAIAELTE